MQLVRRNAGRGKVACAPPGQLAYQLQAGLAAGFGVCCGKEGGVRKAVLYRPSGAASG